MSLTTTILRKDIRQYRILIGILAGLLAVLLAVRLELTGGVAPDPAANSWTPQMLEGFLALLTVIIAGKMVAYLVFEDSPTRKERFLATRPVPGRQLLLAKLGFLAAFVIAPFAIAAALYLILSGMPPRVIALGTLQSILRTLALLGLAVPLVLLWESRSRFSAGIAAGAAGFVVLLLTHALVHESHPSLFPFRPEFISDPLAQVIAIAIAALFLAILATVHLRRPLRMPLRIAGLFLTCAIAPLLAALATTHRPSPPPGELALSPMVHNSLNRQQNDGKATIGINLTPDAPTPPDQDVNWSFLDISLGGHRLPLRPQSDPRLVPAHYIEQSGLTRGLESTLARRLGPDWSLVTSHHGRPAPGNRAWAYAPEDALSADGSRLDVELQGHGYSWHQVAELPLVPGTSVLDGAHRWTFHGSGGGQHDSISLSITHQGPELWLDPRGRRPTLENDAIRFALIDPKRRLAMLLGDRYPVRQRMATSTACPRRGLIVRLDGFEQAHDFATANPESLRLLIFRPRYEGVRFSRWSSPEPLALPSILANAAQGLAKDKRDLEPEDITRWLEQNPGPAPDAPSADVARHLVSLLEQTHRCRLLEKDHPASAALAVYVPGHLELFLRAQAVLHIDQHASRNLLQSALADGLEHRQVADIARHLGTRPALVKLLERRGWTAEIAPDLARLLRNGAHDHALIRAAASLPDTAGITHAEWLAFFRLELRAGSYGILRTIPGLQPELDAIVDARLAVHLPLLRDTSVDPLLELALRRGHPDAPALLHRAVRYATQLSEHNSNWFVHTIRQRIDLSGLSNHHGDSDIIARWFLAHDPATFTFDPTTRLYTAPPSPNQESPINNQ